MAKQMVCADCDTRTVSHRSKQAGGEFSHMPAGDSAKPRVINCVTERERAFGSCLLRAVLPSIHAWATVYCQEGPPSFGLVLQS